MTYRGPRSLKGSATYRAFSRQCLGALSLALISLLQACSGNPYDWKATQNSISGVVVPFNPVASTSGSLRVHASASMTAVCPSAEATLYNLNSAGERVQPPLQTVPVKADGTYSFTDLRKTGIVVKKVNQLTDSYLVEVTGCNSAYGRILTATDKQNIDWATTLVSYVTGTSVAPRAAAAPAEKLEQMYAGLSDTGSFADAYTKLSSTPALNNQFQEHFHVAPVALEDASPMLVEINVPPTMREGETQTFSLVAVQWNTSYTRAYRWELDGNPISHASSLNYAATGNSQGNHTLTVTWGQTDGFGDVDTSKPYRQRQIPLPISNDRPARATSFAAVPALVNTATINLRLNTGAALAGCDTFSRMAITEDLPLAPLNPADYTLVCTAGPTQDIPYTIQGGTGVHTLYLWAIDSAGNLSVLPRTASVHYNDAIPHVDILHPLATDAPYVNSVTVSGLCDDTAGDVTLSGGIDPSPSVTACVGGNFSQLVSLSAGEGAKAIHAEQTNAFGSTGSDDVNISRDSIAPTVLLSSLAPDPTNASAIVVNVTFSENVSGFDISKPIAGNATITAFSGSGASYSLTLQPTAQGLVSLSVPAGAAQDAAGNASVASATFTRLFDSVQPTVVLATSAANPTNLSAVPFTLTFSEPVTGLSAASLTVANGTVSGFTGSGASYSFQVNPAAQGNFTVSLAAATAHDPAGNANTASNSLTLLFDSIRPGVTLATTAAEPTNASPIPVTVTFTEPVMGFALSDLSLTGGTAANLAGSGASYTFDLVPSGQGTVSATVMANTSQDAAANQNTASNTLTRTYDSVAPTTLLATSAGAYSRSSPFAMTITFSKPVTGLSLAGITVTNGTASALAGTGTTYTFTLTPGAEGTVTARVNPGAAQDSATNPSDVSNLVSIVYDITAPTLAVITPVNGDYVNAANQNAFTVNGTCSENGQSVQLAVGAVTQAVACTGGNFSTTLNLSSLADGALTLTANLQDLAGNVAPTQSVSLTKDILAPTATLAGVPASPSNTTTLGITVGGTDVSHYRYKVGPSGSTDCTAAAGYAAEVATAAQITNSIAALADGSITVCAVGRDLAGNFQSFAAATSAAWVKDTAITPFSSLAVTPASPGKVNTPTVSGSTEGNASLSLFKAASCGGPAIATGTAAAGGSFSLTPGATLGADGAYNLSVRATDAAGNTVCSATIPYLLDTTAPTVTVTSAAPNPTNTSPIPITVTFSESVTGFSVAGLTLVNGTASSITGSGTTYTFSITPSAQGNVSVTVNAAAAKDSALNDNVASATLTRLYDSIAPPLTIASPAVGAGTNQNHLVFSGACENGLSIAITGTGVASPASATCSGSNYSVDVQFTGGQGIKNITLTQTDAASNTTSVSRAITYDSIPPSLTFTSAAVRDQITATNTVTFGGACETGTNVVVSGTDTASVPCTGAVWSYTTASQSTDALRSYTFTQTDPGTNTASITGTWQRDTVAPALTRATPPDGTRARDFVTVTGACETGRPINFTGAGLLSPLSPTCSGGAYTQDVYFTAGDGAKAITIQQSDLAGNTTTINASFVRDNVAPVITQTLVTSPYWTNTNSATFGGACEAGLTISVSRDGTPEGTAPCAGGTWTYATAAQSVDGLRTYSFTQTDQATNSTTISAQWMRRTTNPAFAFTSASSFATSTNTVTFYGTCATGITIQVTGADTNSTPCSGGNWSYTTNPQTVDATRTYNFRQTDPAGNYTALVGTWTRNTNLPQLTLTSTSPFYSNGNNTNFTGGCSNGLAITVSGAVSDSIACSSGTWTYPATQTSDGSYTYTFNQTDGFGNSTTINAVWVRDTVAPSVSTISLNSGAAITNTSYVKVALTGSDALSKVTKFCLKSTAAAPASGDSCWVPVNANPPGLTPAPTLNLSNYSHLLGITPGTYSVYAWLQDSAGNISTNAGSLNVDRGQIVYELIYPPELTTVFATNTASPGFPVPSPQLSVAAGATIYIKWRATTTSSFGATPITLSFTTDDITWNTIASVANAANGGCTLHATSADAGTTGCYNWSAPTSGFLRLKIEASDTGNRKTAVSPPPINTSVFRMVAGNSEPGVNTSTLASTYQFRSRSISDWTEINTFVINSNGTLFVNDDYLGIVRVDPEDGLTKVMIPKTGITSADGPVNTASVRTVLGIALDYQERLLIWDNDQIRRVDFTTNTITRIIGGPSASDTSAAIADARNLQFEGYMPLPTTRDSEFNFRNHRVAMVPLPNGDLYFGSMLWPWIEPFYKFRRYREGAVNEIVTVQPTGYGHSGGTGANIANCSMHSMGMQFDTASSAVSHISLSISAHGDAGTKAQCMPDGSAPPLKHHYTWEASLDGNWATKATQPPQSEVANAWAFYSKITGRNGKLYAIRRQAGRAYQWDPAGNAWTMLIGSGTKGQCADGTPALSCNIDIQDMFVTATGQIFFLDQGRIRTLDAANKVVTVFGQPSTSGDGGDPLLARFYQLWTIALETGGGILAYDNNVIREVSPDRSVVNRIVGNGVYDNPSVGQSALNSPFIPGDWWWRGLLVVDPATNDFFFPLIDPTNRGVIGKYERSSGNWVRLFGAGTTPTYSADGMVGDQITLAMHSDEVNYWQHGFLPVGLGSNGKLMVANSSYPNTTVYWRNAFLKTYDANDSWRQRSVVGRRADSIDNEEMCADGTDTSSCTIPIFYRESKTQYDPVDNKWLVLTTRGDAWGQSNRIRAIRDDDGSGTPRTVQTLATLPRSPANFAYWRTGGHEYIYYCSMAGYLYRYDVNSSTETPLTMPATSMRCLPQSTLELDKANSLLYFGIQRNNLHGIAVINAI